MFTHCAVPHICNGVGPHAGTALILSRQDAGAQGFVANVLLLFPAAFACIYNCISTAVRA